MHATLLPALLLWGTGVLGMPAPEPVGSATGLQLPHYFHEIDLMEYDRNNGSATSASLAKRTQVQVCDYTTHGGNCKYLRGSDLSEVTNLMANIFKLASDNNICGYYNEGSSGFNWAQHASNKDTDNNDCTTTAQHATIEGALQEYFYEQDYDLCGVHCLQLKHGSSGTWRGYVSIGSNGYTASNYACGPHSADFCVSGGKKDCDGIGC